LGPITAPVYKEIEEEEEEEERKGGKRFCY